MEGAKAAVCPQQGTERDVVRMLLHSSKAWLSLWLVGICYQSASVRAALRLLWFALNGKLVSCSPHGWQSRKALLPSLGPSVEPSLAKLKDGGLCLYPSTCICLSPACSFSGI